MKRFLKLAGALLLASASLAFASDNDNSPAYSRCMDASGGVTSAMLECMASETALHDARLNSAYSQALTSLADESRRQLRSAQRLWLKYRSAECALRANLTGGSIDRINGGACMLDMTRERANQLVWISHQQG